MTPDPIQLDFLGRPAPRWRWPAWLALVALVPCAVAIAARTSTLREELDSLQSRNDILQQRVRPAAAPSSVPDTEALHRIERANAVIDELTVPWDPLFRAIESADARGMGLLALVPNAQDRSIRLSGETRSVPELLAYVDRVAAQPMLGQVHLLSYDTVPRDGAQVISFTLAARWQQP